MRKSSRAQQARRELDHKFESGVVEDIRTRPRSGWVRVVRDALGMSQAALAKRLEITPSAVHQLEQAEAIGGITLSKLAEVARALDTQLVYALIPNSTLQDTVSRQARRIASERLGYVEATMALENQEIGDERQQEAIESYAQELIDHGSIWESR
jgi:predicted DNA-binding mobile mystery protein A